MNDLTELQLASNRAIGKMTIPEKLDYYTMPEPNTGCWLWAGCWSRMGYGQIKIRGKSFAAHRLQWERFYGPIPEGKIVCHKCDMPPCINPEHLFLGTHKDNMQDAVQKGRLATGEHNGHSKLTDDDVISILGDKRFARIICKDYGICIDTVYDIRARRTWSHL